MYIFFDELLIKNLFNKIILTFRKDFKPNKMKKEREKYHFSSMKCSIIKIKSKNAAYPIWYNDEESSKIYIVWKLNYIFDF